MKTKVYVAGPYTRGDSVLNVREAILLADQLWDLGFAPFVPHLTMLWHLCVPREYEDWMDIDHEWLNVCDCLFRLPGKSDGADREELYMKEIGKPVFYDIGDLQDYEEASREQ